MAAFYILPPRENLETAVSELFTRLLPGLALPADTWDCLTERLSSSASWPDNVFLIPRDDLPEGEPLQVALVESFGAESGDHIIEIGTRSEPRSWTLGSASVSAVPAAR